MQQLLIDMIIGLLWHNITDSSTYVAGPVPVSKIMYTASYHTRQTPLLKELASQTHKPSWTTGSSETTALALGVHLERHLGGRVDGRLLVARLYNHIH